MAVPVEKHGTEKAHNDTDESPKDENADTTHTLILYNMYTKHSCKVSVVGKYAPREKLTMSNLDESDEVTLSVEKNYAASVEVTITPYTLTHKVSSEKANLGDSGESKST